MVVADGTITQSSFNVGGGTVHNVGDAISNLDSRTTTNTSNLMDLTNKVTNISHNGGGAATPNAVAYDTAAHDKLTLGKTVATTSLTNLTDATLSATSTDAVIGKQLFDTNPED